MRRSVKKILRVNKMKKTKLTKNIYQQVFMEKGRVREGDVIGGRIREGNGRD